MWDARTGTPLLELKGHTGGVSSAAFSPDGARIVTGSQDRTAKVWDARTGTPLLDLKGHTDWDDERGVQPGWGPHRHRRDGRDGEGVGRADRVRLLLELKGHTGGVTSVAFSPDGTRIVTGSQDRTAKVWDARTGTPLLELKGHTGEVIERGVQPGCVPHRHRQ